MFNEDDVIHRYTRKQAIEDGVLIDVSPTAKEAGIRYPTAVTSSVWVKFVQVPAGVQAQDERGRLWDLIWMLRNGIRHSRNETTAFFYLHVRNDNRTVKRYLLKAVCGPDDDGSPCITVMLPEED